MTADDVPPTPAAEPTAPMKPTFGGVQDYTDGRKPWQWESKYPLEARREMNVETYTLIFMLVISILGAGICLGLADQNISISLGNAKLSISFRLLAIFCTGSVGGITFSIKWLIHSVAKGKWHLDRRYWRLMTPAIGGAYACVVMTLFASGMFAAQTAAAPASGIAPTAALAFLVGYFSDGVSGLLSNIANAVFGTLEKK
ncbi:hypothetical protein [Sphingomonas colocasiae]|uniref:Uncharacterized protein n=1 Tax=Sphingomonas colocasiae TaxID=1848973 RepID=A0ABS7PR66_9SPHN|nr:hypothetical protein [Sphingomonas colocasiae]MBY8823746.1 hypothetical protein [Sphingomonas colocasiae]